MRIWLLLALVVAAPALAQKKKVVVDAPSNVAKAVGAALAKKYEAVHAAKPMSATPLTKEIREACEPTGAVAVVIVRAVAGGYSVQVLSAFDGTPLDTFDFRGAPKKPLKALPKPAATQLNDALQEARAAGEKPKPPPVEVAATPAPTQTAPTAPAPQPVAEKPAVAERTPTPTVVSEPSGPPPNPEDLRTAFRASFGFREFNRALNWDSTKSASLSGYSVGLAPAIAVGATWFPAAGFTTGFIANLGVTTLADIGVGLDSSPLGDKNRFGTSTIRFQLGALVRLPLSTVFEVNAGAGYSSQTFTVSAQSVNGKVNRPDLPGVAFNGPRAMVGVRLNKLGPVSIDVTAGFMYAIGKGEVGSESFFPKATVFGVDAGAGVSLALTAHVEARLGFDYSRYFIRPNAAGAIVTAGSGSDQYISGNVSLVFVL